MKLLKSHILTLLLFVGWQCMAQSPELQLYTQLRTAQLDSLMRTCGFCCDDQLVNSFRQKVDSLNSLFEKRRVRDVYSRRQAAGYCISVDEEHARLALNDIAANIAFSSFVKKYPSAVVSEGLITKYVVQQKRYPEAIVESFNFDLTSSFAEDRIEFSDTSIATSDSRKWLYEYHPNGELTAFYLPNKFYTIKLPEKYAKMVSYLKYMQDVNKIYSSKAKYTTRLKELNYSPAESRFLAFADSCTAKPNLKTQSARYLQKDPESAYAEYINDVTFHNSVAYDSTQLTQPMTKDEFESEHQKTLRYVRWFNTRFSTIDNFSDSKLFVGLLKDAVSAAQKRGYTSEEMDEYAQRYWSKAIALDLMRGKITYSAVGCGNDRSPHYHEVDICRLSLEQMDVKLFASTFLSSIANDFYPIGNNENYSAALDRFHFKTNYLILGAMLHTNLTDTNRYSPLGDFDYWQLQYLQRSSKLNETIDALVGMVADSSLDDWNRLSMLKMTSHILPNQKNHDERYEPILKKMISSLPVSYQKRLNQDTGKEQRQ